MILELFVPFLSPGKEKNREEIRGGWGIGAGKKAQLKKCLAHRHEDLSSNPNTCLDIQVCPHRFVTPALGRLRQEDLSEGLVSSGPARDAVSKEVDLVAEGDTHGCHLVSIYVHTGTSTCTGENLKKSHKVHVEKGMKPFSHQTAKLVATALNQYSKGLPHTLGALGEPKMFFCSLDPLHGQEIEWGLVKLDTAT